MADDPGVEVRRVPASRTTPLRAAVLRPGRPASCVETPDDDAPETAFWAAVTPDGAVRSTVNVRPSPPPWDPQGEGWWQLRGMATAEAARGRGLGAAVLRAALAHVEAAGGRVWCNARPAAMGLYAREGFGPVGEPFDHPEHGPHQAMVRP